LAAKPVEKVRKAGPGRPSKAKLARGRPPTKKESIIQKAKEEDWLNK